MLTFNIIMYVNLYDVCLYFQVCKTSLGSTMQIFLLSNSQRSHWSRLNINILNNHSNCIQLFHFPLPFQKKCSLHLECIYRGFHAIHNLTKFTIWYSWEHFELGYLNLGEKHTWAVESNIFIATFSSPSNSNCVYPNFLLKT